MKKLVYLLLTMTALCSLPALAETSADDSVMREGFTAVEITRLMGNGMTSHAKLFNKWVGQKSGMTATPLNKNAPEMKKIKNITVTFERVAPAE